MTNDAALDHDFDGFWKEALDAFLVEFLALVAPELHAAIDPTASIESLEQELQALFPEGRSGRRFVDKLFRLCLLDGARVALLLHVEIQGERDDDLPRRVFTYHYRLIDRHHEPVLSVVVLTDDDSHWHPRRFEQSLFGQRLQFEFRVVKLKDFEPRLAEMEASPNPFALVIAIHLRTRQTRPDAQRLEFKKALLRVLFARGYERERIAWLFRLLDWLMVLPKSLERDFRKTRQEMDEVAMPLLSRMELEAIERGREEGLANGLAKGLAEGLAEGRRRTILRILEVRFGALSDEIKPRLERIDESQVLERLSEIGATCGSLEAFVAALPP